MPVCFGIIIQQSLLISSSSNKKSKPPNYYTDPFIMRSFSVLALSSLAAIASAAPAPQVGTGVNDPNYSWQVTEWEAGCARAGCYYRKWISTIFDHSYTNIKILRIQHHRHRIHSLKTNTPSVLRVLLRSH